MARKCQVSKLGPQFGHRVSHANNKTKHTFLPNLQKKRVYVASLGKFVRLRVSTRMLRSIDKLGLEGALKKHGLSVSDLA